VREKEEGKKGSTRRKKGVGGVIWRREAG